MSFEEQLRKLTEERAQKQAAATAQQDNQGRESERRVSEANALLSEVVTPHLEEVRRKIEEFGHPVKVVKMAEKDVRSQVAISIGNESLTFAVDHNNLRQIRGNTSMVEQAVNLTWNEDQGRAIREYVEEWALKAVEKLDQ